MTVLEFLSNSGIHFDRKETDNAYVECPDCGKLNLSVNVFSGAWHCWTSECKERGNRGNLPLLAQKLNIPIEGISIEAAPAPPRDKTLSKEDADRIKFSNQNKAEIIQWAATRGLDPTFVLEQGVGYDKDKRAIVFPFRNPKGELIGAKYKSLDNGDQWIKGQEPELFLLDPYDLQREKIIVVEGEVDAYTLKMCGLPVGATLGASKDKGFNLLAPHRQVYLGYDMDDAGEIGAEKAAQSLGRYRCRRVSWTSKDPNDMLKEGRSKEDILECVKTAKILATDLKSLGAENALIQYMTSLSKKKTKRLSWGYPQLDALTNGLGGGEFIGVLAEAGTGKTTFILNVARNNAHAGVNVGIASLEEHNVNEITPKLTAAMVGRNPGTGSFSEEEIASIRSELGRVQLYDGDEHVQGVVSWIKECYHVHDTRLIFIDYLQLLIGDEKDVQLVKEVCYTFKKLVKAMPGLCIVMIIQPKQKQRARLKDGTEAKSMALEGADARGGAAINQSVDKMLTIEAVVGHPNITQYKYTKVRGHLHVSKRAWLGKLVQLEYDHATLRQQEVPAQQVYYGG